jgi:SAM-dependent methyltransferase
MQRRENHRRVTWKLWKYLPWRRELTASSSTDRDIRSDDGAPATPSSQRDKSQHPWFKSAKRALLLAFPAGLVGRRIVDLGCLEGGYTIEFARLGMAALGIEVRQSNFDKCIAAKATTGLSNLNFAHDTVWNLAKYGEFDAIFCSGLLYHLDRPREFIRLASSVCKTICLYQTHFATEWEIKMFELSKIAENEGLKGRWYKEHAQVSEEELEALNWASWDNQRSFWLMREDLVGSIHANGFDMVFEQYDCLPSPLSAAMTTGYYKTDNRCMFVGIRTGVI